jgi:alpha-L-rhamnosidase
MNTAVHFQIPEDHPLRSAKWIWPERYMYLYNHFAQFRKDFELDSVPNTAPLFITADKAYKLYINGTFVCRGPARGYVEHWPFDEVDAAPQLRPGHNWISVQAYNPGISTFQYLHKTCAGLLCAARWGNLVLVSDTTWKKQRSPAHATQTARYSLQLDFQEHVDCSRQDQKWITDPNLPAYFAVEPEFHSFHDALSFGTLPYLNVEPRGIPLMRETLVAPKAITGHAIGTCDDGYRDCQNVSWHWVAEAGRIKQWSKGNEIKGRMHEDALELVIEPAGEGKFHAVAVDIGEYVVGNMLVSVEGAIGGEILDFQHSERFLKDRPALNPPKSACVIALANRMRLLKGQTEHEFFHILGFRVLTVIARDVVKPLTIRLRVRSAGYPFTMRGEFECSDSVLNEIHGICRHTQQICALDSYVDTPWREQAQWWGDSRVQARNTFYLDGDARLLARGIRSIADQAGPDGLTYGHAPTTAHACVLPDFSLTWILTLWDYYWQTGDISLFRDMWPRAQEILAYFDSKEARASCGLLRHDPRFWLFEDWADLYKGEVPTFINLWYLFTLRIVVQLLELAKMKAHAKILTGRANAHEALAVKLLFDRRTKLFRNGLDEAGKPVAGASVHDQTLALMLDLVPQAAQNMLDVRVLPYLRGEKVEGACPSAFWSAYMLEEAARRGYTAEAVSFIRRHWTPMLATGTTWEEFNWTEESGSSASHAWSAHPAYHFVNILGGIVQTAPAWSAIHFAPYFMPGLDHVKALVPSPKGDIAAEWQRKSDQISVELYLPSSVTARIELPGVSEERKGKVHLTWKVGAYP